MRFFCPVQLRAQETQKKFRAILIFIFGSLFFNAAPNFDMRPSGPGTVWCLLNLSMAWNFFGVRVVCLFVCLFGSRYSSSLWWTSPYQGWNLRYPKEGRRDPLHAPETDPSLCRVPGEFAVSGLSRVADWPPERSSSLLRSACWVVG